MTRKVLAVGLVLVMLLSGCSAGGSAMQEALDFRSALLSAGACKFEADITADYLDSVTKFSLSCEYDTDGEADFTVTEPQSIRGIKAKTTRENSHIVFDDTQLAIAPVADGELAPLRVPLLLGECFAGGYIRAAGFEDDSIRITYLHGYDEDELVVEVLFDRETSTPQFCEISKDGRRQVSAGLREFSMN